MNIQQVLADKRVQLAKLQAQIEMLEELAGEVSGGRGRRRASTRGRKRAARRTSGRAGRGANQQRVLSVLTGTPTRASEIARSAGLVQQAVTQVLNALIKKGMAEKTGRGQYRATGESAGKSSEARVPRAAKAKRTARKPRRSLQPLQDANSHHAEEVAHSRLDTQEPWVLVGAPK